MSGINIARLWTAIAYKPSLRFFNQFLDIADRHIRSPDPEAPEKAPPPGYFEHWTVKDKASIELREPKRHEVIQISDRKTVIEKSTFAESSLELDDISRSISSLSNTIRAIVNELKHSDIIRMGVKLTLYTELEMTFDEILERFRKIGLVNNEKLIDIISDDIVDIGLHIDYKYKGNTAMLRAGPMSHDEGTGALYNIGTIKSLCEDPGVSDDLYKFTEAIPEAFLYFGEDIFKKSDALDIQEYASFVKEGLDHIINTYNGFVDILLETIDE